MPGGAAEGRPATGLKEPDVDPALKRYQVKCGDFLVTLEAAGVLAWWISDGRPGDLGVVSFFF